MRKREQKKKYRKRRSERKQRGREIIKQKNEEIEAERVCSRDLLSALFPISDWTRHYS